MLDKLTNRLEFHGNALILRAERQRTLASNIANVDTPGYLARDFKFAEALRDVTEGTRSGAGKLLASPSLGERTFSTASLGMATGGSTVGGFVRSTTDLRHVPLKSTSEPASGNKADLGYAVQTQPALDNNSVDLDRERAAFVDNAVRYEATLRFINGNAKTMLSAIQGQ